MITNFEVIHKDTTTPEYSRYSSNRVKVTFDTGDSMDAWWTNQELRLEELRLKFIKLGVDPKDLEEFGDLKYREGSLDESDSHCGAEL